jgi:hypothetical protein
MIQNIRLLLLGLLIVHFSGCNKRTENSMFTLDMGFVEMVRNNEKCVTIFEKGYGIPTNHIKEDLYVESLLNKFLDFNKNTPVKRIVYLQFYREGEIYEMESYAIKVYPDKTIEIVRYGYDEGYIEEKLLKKKKFDFDLFYKELGNENKEYSRNNFLIIDFKSENECVCKFYADLNTTQIEKIRDLSFFDQF